MSGYGTIGAVRTNNDKTEFRSGMRQDKGADSSEDFGVDSRLGLQAVYTFNEQFSAVGQALVSRRDGKEGVQAEWLYAQYAPTQHIDLRLGRLVLPIFMLSDNRNVGYAHYWVRVPQEVYGAYSLTSFDGVQARWRDGIGGFNINVQGSAGTSKANLFSTARVANQFPPVVDAEVKMKYPRLYSLAVSAEKGFWTLRGSKTYGKDLEMTTSGVTWLPKGTDNFTNVGAQYDDGTVVAMAEFVARRHTAAGLVNSDSFYVSGGYRFGAFTPYAIYSHFSPKGGYYRQLNTTPGITRALGLRWDATSSVALKAQVERVRRTEFAFTHTEFGALLNPPAVTAVSVAVDFVF